MGWIDLKFQDLEEATRAQEASSSKVAKEHNARAALAAKAWDRMVEALQADVQQYNQHPNAKKRVAIRVVPNLIEVNWIGELRILLHISRKSGEPNFAYGALSLGASRSEQHSGEIAPTLENEFTLIGGRNESSQVDAARLSEALLSPVLFP